MRRYIILALSMLVAIPLYAADYNDVQTRENARGVLFNRDVMSLAEMVSYTLSPFQYGTARSMAMAGAMASLGADGASMLTNPAGLGMYRHGDLTITPMVSVNKMSGDSYRDNRDTSFGFSNFSTAINLYTSGSNNLISLTLGLGYNRVADFNYSYSIANPNSSSSVSRLFSRQLTAAGISYDDVKGENYPNWNASNIGSNIWGAILGYKTGLTDQINDSTPIWSSSWISDDTIVDQDFRMESSGAIGEYDIAVGGNLSNKFYFGMTLGIQNVSQELDLIYGEGYSNNSAAPNKLYTSGYNQTIKTYGAGVNLKFGVTYRPTEELRVALAYHTPTWYSLNREYQTSVGSYSLYEGKKKVNIFDSPITEDFTDNKWKFRSPSRLILGASYTIMKRALVSIDYQMDNYGNAKVRSLPKGVDKALYSDLSDIYGATNTLRAGAEVKLSPSFALRGGYGYSSSALRRGVDSIELLDIPTTEGVRFYSAGIGYALNAGASLDLTYMNQKTDYSTYTLFYADGDYSPLTNSAASAQSKSYKSKRTLHNIALSIILKI